MREGGEPTTMGCQEEPWSTLSPYLSPKVRENFSPASLPPTSFLLGLEFIPT